VPRIVKTIATTGQGIEELVQVLDNFTECSKKGDLAGQRQIGHSRSRLLDLLRQTLFERALAGPLEDGSLDWQVTEIVAHRKTPHDVVDEIISTLIPSGLTRQALSEATSGVKFHHLGIAVESLTGAVPSFQKLLGKPPVTEETVTDQKVRVVSFHLGNGRVELLEATEADSPIARFIAKRGAGIHHLALAVQDLAGTLRKLESQGVRLIDRVPRAGADCERIAFLHPSSTGGVLIELIEET
jgi:methylmalonyl-CoA/ethylmalonyl-CoA epimerase